MFEDEFGSRSQGLTMAHSFPEPSSAERQFRLLANNAPVLIWRAGPDKVCDWFNKPWLDFTGRTMEQELDNGWFEGVHPDDFDRCFAIYAEAFDRREAFSLEYRLRRHDGVYCWLLDNGRPFFHEDGNFAGYFGSCIDITRQKTTEAELQAALSDREALLAEVNHRVKNNMQLMVGLVHLAGRGAGPDLRLHLKSLSTRIQSVAYVQERLHHARRLSLIDLAGLLEELAPGLASLVGDRHPVRIVGGGVTVE
jgi:PAS domain S-box-containing protein